MARRLQQDHRLGALEREDAVGIGLPRTPRERHHLRPRHHRRNASTSTTVGDSTTSGARRALNAASSLGIGRPHAEQLRPEAHRVLDRVKALEHHEAGVAACALDIAEIHENRSY